MSVTADAVGVYSVEFGYYYLLVFLYASPCLLSTVEYENHYCSILLAKFYIIYIYQAFAPITQLRLARKAQCLHLCGIENVRASRELKC